MAVGTLRSTRWKGVSARVVPDGSVLRLPKPSSVGACAADDGAGGANAAEAAGTAGGLLLRSGDADAAGDPFAGKPRGAVIRSMSRDDVANAGGEDARGLVGGAPDAFVSSILERGPSLEKQLSLGFLDGMSSAEIGDLVRDMQIGQEGDEISQRLETLRGAEAR